jgi:hypothetical protein
MVNWTNNIWQSKKSVTLPPVEMWNKYKDIKGEYIVRHPACIPFVLYSYQEVASWLAENLKEGIRKFWITTPDYYDWVFNADESRFIGKPLGCL